MIEKRGQIVTLATEVIPPVNTPEKTREQSLVASPKWKYVGPGEDIRFEWTVGKWGGFGFDKITASKSVTRRQSASSELKIFTTQLPSISLSALSPRDEPYDAEIWFRGDFSDLRVIIENCVKVSEEVTEPPPDEEPPEVDLTAIIEPGMIKYEGTDGWEILVSAREVPLGAFIELSSYWVNTSPIPIVGEVKLVMTRPDGSTQRLLSVNNQNTELAAGSGRTVKLTPFFINLIGIYSFKAELFSGGQLLSVTIFTLQTIEKITYSISVGAIDWGISPAKFYPGETRGAIVPIKISPAGGGATVQLYLGPDRLSSVGARIVSTGKFEDVMFTMHMTNQIGVYPVILEVEVDGQSALTYTEGNLEIAVPTNVDFSVVLVNPRPGLESWNVMVRVGPFNGQWRQVSALEGKSRYAPNETPHFRIQITGTMDLPYFGAFDVNQYLWHPYPTLTLEIGGKYYPDRRWVEGYWLETDFGRFWIEGHWEGTGYQFLVSKDVSVSHDMVVEYNDGG